MTAASRRFPRLARVLPAPVLAIVAVTVALRLVALVRVFEPPDVWMGDPRSYLDIMQGLREGHLIPETWIWPPGYPALGLILSPLVGGAISLHVLSFTFGAALPLLLLWAGRVSGLAQRGRLAAWIVAVHPEAVLASARPLSEATGLTSTVLAILLLEVGLRRGRVGWAIAAGVLGGLAALIRPEAAAAIVLAGLIAIVAHRKRLPVIAAGGAASLLVLAPYVLHLHAASGTWALSLKLHYNVQKHLVYQRGSDFVEKRLLWEEYLKERGIDDGELDPRRLVESFETRRWLLHPEMPGFWLGNVRRAFRRDPWLVDLLWITGITGLLFPGKRGKRERILAIVTGVPVLAVPVLFPPVERYALVALPALAWGSGTTLARIASRLGRPRSVWRLSFLGAVALLALSGGARGLARGTRDSHWTGRNGEFLVALHRGDLALAERIVRDGLRLDPGNPAIHESRGNLAFARGSWSEAVLHYRRAAALGGPDDRLALLRGRALGRAGRAEEARRALEHAARSPRARVREAARRELQLLDDGS